MYNIDPPKEVKEDIIKCFNRMSGKIYVSFKIKVYLLEVYYRYIENISPKESVQKKVKNGLKCNVCFNEAYKYFKGKIKQYENDTGANKSK